MCGIVGYVGRKNAVAVVMDGLRRLEYRGYDSAGIAVWDGASIHSARAAGRVASLENIVAQKGWNGVAAIAHTRWATHGKPTARNAHPHADCTNSIFVVHNGVIENYHELKEALMREGHSFRSDTDTEVLAHLIERSFLVERSGVLLEDAVIETLRHATGTLGIAVISQHDPFKIVAARRGSPLVIGVGDDEYIVASDIAAIVGHIKHVLYLHDNELAVLTRDGVDTLNVSKQSIHKPLHTIEWNVEDAQRGGFSHFMQKEIFEGPQTLENALRGRLLSKDNGVKLGGLEGIQDKLKEIQRIIIVACGTSYYAGLVGKYYFEELSRIPTSVEYASEFRYQRPVIEHGTAVIAISQSGETADTLEAMREAKRQHALVLGIVNVVGSTIARESDAGVYNHAGPEIGVASTKAFISQLGVLLLGALSLAQQRSISSLLFEKVSREFKALPAKMKRILEQDAVIKRLAERYLPYQNFLYLGRRYQFPVALEGALKLKEISYKHAEGYPAGEMKHGPIALIDKNFPVIALAPRDATHEKTLSNIEEIKARDGKIIAVATEGDTRIASLADDVVFIPHTLDMLVPLLSVIPLQLFAYHTAALLGLDVDKPRNLAKSVTVE